MITVVCDASILAAILLPDEWTERVPIVARELAAAELWAPAHFALEIASVLVSAERRSRIDRIERLRCLTEAQAAGVLIDPLSSIPSAEITDLALRLGLSVYDAAYLELAIRKAAVIATNDRRLIAAARDHGLDLLTTMP